MTWEFGKLLGAAKALYQPSRLPAQRGDQSAAVLLGLIGGIGCCDHEVELSLQ